MKQENINEIDRMKASAWESISTAHSLAQMKVNASKHEQDYEVIFLLGKIEGQKRMIDKFIDSISD